MQTLGKYHILSELGKGGFATVYRAEDTTLGREVALKVLDPLLMRDTAWVERFRQEARAVAALDHPAIVTVHEIAEAEGRLFIAMKLIRGPSLDAVLAERGALPWEETQRILRQVTTALDYAHGKGILHRDLKPGNVLLDPQNGAVLTDFGFARLVGESSMSVSLSGGLVGTPSYIAPELWHNRSAGVQSDLYALGCILYELITGRKAFTGDTPPAVMMAHFQPFQTPETWPEGTPLGVADVLRRTLAQEPGDRYASAGEFLAALDALQIDPLAEPYAALQNALAAEEWDAALRLAENLRAQQPDYRDVAALAQQAQAGWDKAQRIQAAAPWKEQAQAALKAGQPAVAQAALAQWLKLTPEDEAAQRMQAQLARETAGPDLTGFPKPVRSSDAVTDVPAKPPAERSRPESVPSQKSSEVVQGSQVMTHPEHPVKSGSIPGWVWAVGLLALIAALIIGNVIGENLRATPTPEVITVVETVEKTVFVTAAPPPAASALTDTPPFDAKLGNTWTRPADGMVMVYVPAGEFKMGSRSYRCNHDEEPMHTVKLDAFWIDQTEVTNAQYEKCAQAGACAASNYLNFAQSNGNMLMSKQG